MLETWIGNVILSEFCQLTNYKIPGTENVIKSESAIHYQIETKDGLIVDFYRRSLDSVQAPGSNVVRIIAHPMEPIYRVGEEIIVTGRLIQLCDSKIIVECTEITEDPAKYSE